VSPYPVFFSPGAKEHSLFSSLLIVVLAAAYSEGEPEGPISEKITTGFCFKNYSPVSKNTCQSQRDRKSLEIPEAFRNGNTLLSASSWYRHLFRKAAGSLSSLNKGMSCLPLPQYSQC
jgi:hypothetical protein